MFIRLLPVLHWILSRLELSTWPQLFTCLALPSLVLSTSIMSIHHPLSHSQDMNQLMGGCCSGCRLAQRSDIELKEKHREKYPMHMVSPTSSGRSSSRPEAKQANNEQFR
jgi:hypothetical protein